VGPFLILILIFGAVWVLFILPARRRKLSHAAMQDTVSAGDDVITAGGIHGSVREVADDLVQVEIAPGVVVQVDRRAIAAVARDADADADDEPDAAPDAVPDPAPEAETGHGASEEPS
jgi:preprotein translocase subunit YajC